MDLNSFSFFALPVTKVIGYFELYNFKVVFLATGGLEICFLYLVVGFGVGFFADLDIVF